jgi:phage-related minor tail protein
MAGKIIGINIELNADSSGITKSLKEVDKSLNTTASALKSVNSALKLDPKNVELLAQKQELLAKQISGTNEKLKLMKQVAEEAAKGLEDGTVTKEQYAKLQAEIVKTEQSLKAMGNASEDNKRAMEDAGNATVSLSDKMASLDESIKNTEKALKNVDAALKLDPGNTELIAQKQELLAKQVDQTRERLDLMKEAAVKAAEGLEKGTVTKEEYASLTAQIATTEKELGDLEAASNETAAAMMGVGEGAEETADDLEQTSDATDISKDAFNALNKVTGGLASALMSLATNPLTAVVAALAALVTIAKKVIDKLKEVANTIKNAIVGAVKLFVEQMEKVTHTIDATMQKLAELTKAGADYADQVNTLASKTGLATDEIQRLMAVAELVDVSVETMTGSMTKLEKSMSSAASGSKDTAKAFKDLGVEIKNDDGTYRDLNTVFYEVISALGKIKDPVERDTKAMSLLGKSAKELNPLINRSEEELNEFNKSVEQSGIILSGDVLNQYQAYSDALVMLDNGMLSLKNGLGLVLLPALTDLAQQGVPLLNEFASGVVNAQGDIEEIGKVIDKTVPKALEMIINNLPQFVEIVKKLINTSLTTIRNNLPEILKAGIEIIRCLADGLLNPESIEAIKEGIIQIVDAFVEFLDQHGQELIDLGVFVIVSLINGLSDALPRLIPAVADAIITIVDALTSNDNLDKIIDAAIQVFEALIDGMDRALPAISEKLPEFIQKIADKIIESQMIEKIVDAGITLFTAIIDSGIIEKVMDVLGKESGPIAELLMKIGAKLYEKKDLVTDMFGKILSTMLDSCYQMGQDMAIKIIDGMVDAMWLRPEIKAGLKTVFSILEGKNSSYNYPVENPANNWAPSRDASQAPISGAGEEQFWHGDTSSGGGRTISTGSSAMSMMASASNAASIVEAINSQNSTTVIPVYIGDEKITTVVANANNEANYIGGGRG